MGNRLNKLNQFACDWLADNTSKKVAKNWCGKFNNNTNKFRKRFALCGYYDETSEHGGPRGRREADEDDFRISEDPALAIKQITTGYRKWAQRYIEECGLQPAVQVDRANKWLQLLLAKANLDTYGPIDEPLGPEDDEPEADKPEDDGY